MKVRLLDESDLSELLHVFMIMCNADECLNRASRRDVTLAKLNYNNPIIAIGVVQMRLPSNR